MECRMITHIDGRDVTLIIVDHDNKVVTIEFKDGSKGVVDYTKERLVLKGAD